jgi:hypothetical protein
LPRLVGSPSRIEYNLARGETCAMKKPSKTAAELEASIKVEMEDICDWPTDMTVCRLSRRGDDGAVAVADFISEGIPH